jgi:hypothetical protein
MSDGDGKRGAHEQERGRGGLAINPPARPPTAVGFAPSVGCGYSPPHRPEASGLSETQPEGSAPMASTHRRLSRRYNLGVVGFGCTSSRGDE